MDLFLLGGNKKASNKDWISSVAEACRKDFDECKVLNYSHWELDDQVNIDVNKETERFADFAGKSRDYCIFAKSAGAIVAMKAMKEGRISPKRCIFVGLPIKWADGEEIKIRPLIGAINVPTLFIQKSEDPACFAEELEELIGEIGVRNFRFFEIPGEDHRYEDLDMLEREVKDFCRKE